MSPAIGKMGRSMANAGEPNEENKFEKDDEMEDPQVVVLSEFSAKTIESESGRKKEAAIGFEPMVADLQSAGLATCLRRLTVSLS